MATQDSVGTIYPVAQLGQSFLPNSQLLKVYLGPESLNGSDLTTYIKSTNLVDTITTPLFTAIVVSAVTGKEYVINKLIVLVTTNNFDINLPLSHLTFVLDDGDDVPQIGPMDEIYIYGADNVLRSAFGINVISPDQFDIKNRIFTGVVHNMHEMWSKDYGQMYQIDFTTPMKKLAVTSEFNSAAFPTPGQVAQPAIPVTIGLSFSPYKSTPGEYIRIACAQSNVTFAYVYDPKLIFDANQSHVTVNQQVPNYPPNQDAVFNDSGFWNPAFYPNGTATDQYGIITELQYPLMKSLFLYDIEIIDHDYQTWMQILADALEGSFLEMFFSKLGLLYARQMAMFRSSGDVDWTIDPSIIIDYNDADHDDNIITRLYTGVDMLQLGQTISPFIFAPPDYRSLEGHYGPRYKAIQVPWAIWAAAAPTDPNGKVNVNLFQTFLQEYAKLYLATHNLNTLRGTCTLLGFSEFELGQTVYFYHKDKVFYITGIQHSITAGGAWTTTLSLEYGRPIETDYKDYIKQSAVSLSGEVIVQTQQDPTSTPTAPSTNDPLSDNSTGQSTDNDIILAYNTNLGGLCQEFVQDVFGLPKSGGDAADSFSIYANGTPSLLTPNPKPGDFVYFQRNVVFNGNHGHVGFLNNDGFSFTSVFNDGNIHKTNIKYFQKLNQVGVIGYITNPQGNVPPNIIVGFGISSILTSLVGSSISPQTYMPQNSNLILANGYWQDPNFKNDVKRWATLVASGLNARGGDIIRFFMAKSCAEIQSGNKFSGRWNFANIQTGDLLGGSSNQLGYKQYDYPNVDVNASATVSFLQGSNYSDFLDYIKSSDAAVSFDVNKAADLLNAKWAQDPNASNVLEGCYQDIQTKGWI